MQDDLIADRYRVEAELGRRGVAMKMLPAAVS
jgi:hypothetical protein